MINPQPTRQLLLIVLSCSCLNAFACDSATIDSDDDDGSDQSSDTSTFDGDTADGSDTLNGPCPSERHLGGFEVSVYDTYSSASGAVSDGIVPVAVPDEVSSADDCRLLKRRNLLCDPPCKTGETCDVDGTCIPYPRQRDVGTVTIDGLEQELAMTARPPENTYFDTQVVHPLFEPGRAIRFHTTEGFIGAIDANGVGVLPVELTDDEWTVAYGQPLTINWKPQAEDPRIRIQLRLNVDQHGVTPLTLICDFADTGQAEVPADFITALIDGGISGFANGDVTRRSVDSVEIESGCVEFNVSSRVTAKVTLTEG